jgi:putative endonuclease
MLTDSVTERWWAYFLRCADGSLYAGATNDLPGRLRAHQSGKGARYTRSRLPVTLVWSRKVTSRSKALSLEARLKTLSRTDKLALTEARLPRRKLSFLTQGRAATDLR